MRRRKNLPRFARRHEQSRLECGVVLRSGNIKQAQRIRAETGSDKAGRIHVIVCFTDFLFRNSVAMCLTAQPLGSSLCFDFSKQRKFVNGMPRILSSYYIRNSSQGSLLIPCHAAVFQHEVLGKQFGRN